MPKRPAPKRTHPAISVIVLGYNMSRELPRTIRSLSPMMQRDIDPRDYEVILIDHGSMRPFDEDELRRLLPGSSCFASRTPRHRRCPRSIMA